MQARPYSELDLQNKILNKKTSAIGLIDLFPDDDEAKLNSIDADGKSFLFHALSARFKEVADKLLALQINDPIIFKADKSGQNCLFIAIQEGYTDIFKIILDKAAQAKPGTPGHKIWLKSDPDGNTLLHMAAIHRNIEAAELLLTQIAQENEETREWIIDFKTYQERNTPLYLACVELPTSRNNELISLLIKHGAGLERINKNQKTPFNFICKFTLSEQIELVTSLLKNEKQEIFLSCYKAYFSNCANNKKEPDVHDADMLANYNTLCNARDRIITYDAAMEKDTGGVYVEMPSWSLPYLSKEMKDFASDTDETRSRPTKIISTHQQLLELNEESIKDEIAHLEKFINELKARPTKHVSGKIFFVLAAVAIITLYVGMETWLVRTEKQYLNMYLNRTDPNREKYWRPWSAYSSGAIIFGIMGAFLTVFALAGIAIIGRIFSSYLDISIKISPEEWNQLITNLQNTWLEGMQELERKQEQDNLNEEHRLSPQLIRDFEDNIAVFGDDRKTVKTVIDEMTNINENLASIQNYIVSKNTSILPLSMFKRDTKIDISSARVEEVNEDSALLSNRYNV